MDIYCYKITLFYHYYCAHQDERLHQLRRQGLVTLIVFIFGHKQICHTNCFHIRSQTNLDQKDVNMCQWYQKYFQRIYRNVQFNTLYLTTGISADAIIKHISQERSRHRSTHIHGEKKWRDIQHAFREILVRVETRRKHQVLGEHGSWRAKRIQAIEKWKCLITNRRTASTDKRMGCWIND